MGYLRPNQVDEIENEKSVIERTLQHPRVEDRANMQAHVRRIDEQLEKQAPPDLTGEQRDERTRECREIEGRLAPLMPSHEQMRRNPPGVVGQHKRYDKASKSRKYFKEGDIFRWKDNQLALHKGDDDPDIANFERMRPVHNHGSMLGAQIEGKTFHGLNPSPQFLAEYDRIFGTNVNGETSAGAPAAEVEDETIVDPPVKRARKKATSKKNGAAKRTRAPNKKAPVQTALACGKMMGPSGRHFHVAKCETCQEAAKE